MIRTQIRISLVVQLCACQAKNVTLVLLWSHYLKKIKIKLELVSIVLHIFTN